MYPVLRFTLICPNLCSVFEERTITHRWSIVCHQVKLASSLEGIPSNPRNGEFADSFPRACAWPKTDAFVAIMMFAACWSC